MKIHLYIYQKDLDAFSQILKNPWQDFDIVSLYKRKSDFSNNKIMISLDYDTYINMLDQNKIEIK